MYLNVPDNYFLAGSNKTGMGYRETNWSLPRDQQHVHARPALRTRILKLGHRPGDGAEVARIELLPE